MTDSYLNSMTKSQLETAIEWLEKNYVTMMRNGEESMANSMKARIEGVRKVLESKQ